MNIRRAVLNIVSSLLFHFDLATMPVSIDAYAGILLWT